MSKHEWTKFWYEESAEMTPEEAIRAFREVHPDAARWWGIDTAAPETETEPRIRGMQSKIAKQSHRIRQLTIALEQERNRDAVASRLRVECETLRNQRDRLRASKDTWVSLWQRTLAERNQFQDEVAELTKKNQDALALAVEEHNRAERLHAEVERLREALLVYENALWKACGDDEGVVTATLESQGVDEMTEPIKWSNAPDRTSWGASMRVADIALDRDHTLTLFCEADQTAKVDAMFAEVERLREAVGAEREACLKIAEYCADADLHASIAANAIRSRKLA